MKDVSWELMQMELSALVWCSRMGEKNTLRWLGHVERNRVKKVCVNEAEGKGVRG